MIELITGKPGAGKTYLAVMKLLDLEAGKYVVFHNIDGLKHDKMVEPSMFQSIPDDPSFYSKEGQISYAEAVKEKYGRPMLVVIDEAQMVFGEKDAGKKGWLSWHRHLGQDIWLICQHNKMIHQDYYNLCEYEIRALKSPITRMLVYQYRVGNEAFKTVRKSRRMNVYDAYQSFTTGEVAKQGAGYGKWIAALVLLALGSGYYFISGWAGGGVGAAAPPPAPPLRSSHSSSATRPPAAQATSPISVWDQIGYCGVMGGKVLVRLQGVIMDLGDAVGENYHVVKATGQSCIVETKSGRKLVRKRSLEPVEASFEPGHPAGSKDGGHQRRGVDNHVGNGRPALGYGIVGG